MQPTYESLLDQLKSVIGRGISTPGTKPPPQRELADYPDINFTIVTRIHKLNAQFGLTCGIHDKGIFVNLDGIDPLTANPLLTRAIDPGFVASFEQTDHLLDNTLSNTVKQDVSQLSTYDPPTGCPIDKEALQHYPDWLGVRLTPT